MAAAAGAHQGGAGGSDRPAGDGAVRAGHVHEAVPAGGLAHAPPGRHGGRAGSAAGDGGAAGAAGGEGGHEGYGKAGVGTGAVG